MLSFVVADPSTPAGLNARFAYYCTCNFFCRGGQELRDIDNTQFQLIKDKFGDECVKFISFLFVLVALNLFRLVVALNFFRLVVATIFWLVFGKSCL